MIRDIGPVYAEELAMADLTEIEKRDRCINELTDELERERKLVRDMRQHVERTIEGTQRWADTLYLSEESSREPDALKDYENLRTEFNELVRLWNRYIEMAGPRPMGRPLQASDAQIAEVRKLRKAGASLRKIATETWGIAASGLDVFDLSFHQLSIPEQIRQFIVRADELLPPYLDRHYQGPRGQMRFRIHGVRDPRRRINHRPTALPARPPATSTPHRRRPSGIRAGSHGPPPTSGTDVSAWPRQHSSHNALPCGRSTGRI
jgi:hypothetical protein